MFTAENAAEMGKRGNVALAAVRERTKALVPDPAEESRIAEEHRKLRLVRVRKQQARVDEMLLVEEDAGKLDRLASAAIRLNEQERQLSNRSLPPTLKASQPRSKRSTSADPEPE